MLGVAGHPYIDWVCSKSKRDKEKKNTKRTTNYHIFNLTKMLKGYFEHTSLVEFSVLSLLCRRIELVARCLNDNGERDFMGMLIVGAGRSEAGEKREGKRTG